MLLPSFGDGGNDTTGFGGSARKISHGLLARVTRKWWHRLWQSRGKKAETRQMLTKTYGWFTKGFDTADLQEAKVLLEELSQCDIESLKD